MQKNHHNHDLPCRFTMLLHVINISRLSCSPVLVHTWQFHRAIVSTLYPAVFFYVFRTLINFCLYVLSTRPLGGLHRWQASSDCIMFLWLLKSIFRGLWRCLSVCLSVLCRRATRQLLRLCRTGNCSGLPLQTRFFRSVNSTTRCRIDIFSATSVLAIHSPICIYIYVCIYVYTYVIIINLPALLSLFF